MTRALAHRGPDGAGHTVVGRIALVHTRLAIIDLEGGDQPLFAGPAALVANGEIYNYRELRAELPERALRHQQRLRAAAASVAARGRGLSPSKLRGMYAIAIHERAARTVTLSRDPFGIKPLYTAQIEGGLAFASEPQALLEAGLVARGVRPAAREELLQLQFTTGAETIFPGIQRVLPGETLTCAEGHVHRAPASRGAAGRRARADRRGGGARPARRARWKRASICTSAATCRTACSSRAASTAPRSSR